MKEDYADMQNGNKRIVGKNSKTTARNKSSGKSLHETIRKELNEEISKKKISMLELTRRTRIPPTTIKRMLDGEIATPSFDKVVSLYNALGLELPTGSREKPIFTMKELILRSATLMASPAEPSAEDVKKATILIQALVFAKAVAVKDT